jgi:disulfide bond formation protein DsbB
MIQKIVVKLDQSADYIVWAIATASLFGSLYFSEVMNLAPCMLCWWQRIFMYPLAILMSVAILRKDRAIAYYVLPMSVLGTLLGFYHSLLQWGIVKETVLDCSANAAVSCSNAQINWLGFITIPFMSFLAFAGITVVMGLRIWVLKNTKD